MKISENAVEKAVIRFMQQLGWRASRNHVGLFFPLQAVKQILSNGAMLFGLSVTIGIEGFPDWTFTRGTGRRGYINMLHFEAKATGKKPAPKQLEVMASLNHIGEPSVWADSLDSFKVKYFESFPEDLERAA